MRRTAELPTSTDVVVVGAGPVGLAMAATLAAYGVRSVLLDGKPRSTSRSNALVVHARTLEVLDDLGASAGMAEHGVVVPRFTIRDRDRALIQIRFDGLETPFPHLLMCPQNLTEEVLERRLNELGGAILRPYRVTGVRQDSEGSAVTVTPANGADGADRADADGEPAEIRCRYVVGCDGMNSTVRTALGIEFGGASYDQPFVLADFRMDPSHDGGLRRDEVNLFFSPEGLVVVAPFGTDTYRLVAPVDSAPAAPGAADVQELLDRRGPGKHRPAVREIVWSSRFLVHHRVATRYRVGSVFLCGDAAHVHSPAGGQGMNTGIQDAYNLGWKLAMVLAGTADERLLDSYEDERLPVAEHVVTTTDRLTRAATLRRKPARRLRNLLLGTAGRLPKVRHALAMELSQLAVGYPNGRGRHPRAGDRAPVERLPAASGPPTWRLLVPTERVEPSLAAAAAASHIPVAVHGSREVDTAVLVRPDGYIWSTAATAEAGRLVAALPAELGGASASEHSRTRAIPIPHGARRQA